MRGTEMTWTSQVFRKGGGVGVAWGSRSLADVVYRGTVFPYCSLLADTSGQWICTAIWPAVLQAQAAILPSKEPSLGVSHDPLRHPPCWEPISSAWDCSVLGCTHCKHSLAASAQEAPSTDLARVLRHAWVWGQLSAIP